jgi:hypothetical protein
MQLPFDFVQAGFFPAEKRFGPKEENPKGNRRSLHFGRDDSVVVMNVLVKIGVHVDWRAGVCIQPLD